MIPLLLTLKVAGWATVFASIAGVAVAYALARLRFPGQDVVDAAMTLPMVLPPTVLGYYILVVVGRRGPVGGWLEQNFGITLIFTWQGAVIAAAYYAYDAAGEPVWYFGDNRGAGGRVALNRFTARCPTCARPDPQADTAGTLVLSFQGETAMRARIEAATALVAPEWRLGDRALEMLNGGFDVSEPVIGPA